MLHERSPQEIALASSAMLLQLLNGLVDRKLMSREQMLVILDNAADELVRDPQQLTDVHILAAEIIRSELAPRV